VEFVSALSGAIVSTLQMGHELGIAARLHGRTPLGRRTLAAGRIEFHLRAVKSDYRKTVPCWSS